MSDTVQCPYCGYEKAKLTTRRSGVYSRSGDMFQVLCGRCKARGPIVTYKYANGFIDRDSAKEKAKTLWNTRHVDGDTSDGYHTFNELYDHRAKLFSVIVKNYPSLCWKSKLHSDGSMFDDMFIVGIDTPSGQATYHYNINPYWDMFECKEVERAPEWDGHTSAEAIDRITSLKRSINMPWG